MKTHSDDAPDQPPSASAWRKLLRDVYQAIAPNLIYGAGALILLFLTFLLSDNIKGAWVTGCLAVILAIGYLSHLIHQYTFQKPRVKPLLYAFLGFLVLCCCLLLVRNLTRDPEKTTLVDTAPSTSLVRPSTDSLTHHKEAPQSNVPAKPRHKLLPKGDTTGINIGDNNVVSFNQQGGITAHTVNINGVPDRTIPENKRPAAIQMLSAYRGAKIEIQSMEHDGEASMLGDSFSSLFAASGWNVSIVNAIQRTGPYPPGITLLVLVDSAKPDLQLIQQGRVVHAAVKQLGLDVNLFLSHESVVTRRQLELWIGSKLLPQK